MENLFLYTCVLLGTLSQFANALGLINRFARSKLQRTASIGNADLVGSNRARMGNLSRVALYYAL